MKITIYLHLLVLSLFLSINMYAQPGRGRKMPTQEDLETQRVNLYTSVLNLTPDEAKKFWPIYNQFSDARELLQKERRKLTRSYVQGSINMTDAEIDKALQDLFAIEQKMLDNRKKYYMDAKKALPMRKIILLQKAENEFKRSLIQNFRAKKSPMGAPQQGSPDEY